MLAPGFFERVQTHRAAAAEPARSAGRRLSQAVRRVARRGAPARHPLPAGLTAGDFVAKLRAEGLLCLTAGENVLRILPPLDRRRARDRRGAGDHRQGRAAMAGIVSAVAPGADRARRCSAAGRTAGAAAAFPRYRPVRHRRSARHPRSRLCLQERPARPAARRQDPGDDLREAVDPHPRLVRGGDAAARRRRDHPRHRRQPARPRRDRSPTPRGCCRAMSMRS